MGFFLFLFWVLSVFSNFLQHTSITCPSPGLVKRTGEPCALLGDDRWERPSGLARLVLNISASPSSPFIYQDKGLLTSALPCIIHSVFSTLEKENENTKQRYAKLTIFKESILRDTNKCAHLAVTNVLEGVVVRTEGEYFPCRNRMLSYSPPRSFICARVTEIRKTDHAQPGTPQSLRTVSLRI